MEFYLTRDTQIGYGVWCLIQKYTNFFTNKKLNIISSFTDFLLNYGAILLVLTIYSSEPLLLASLILLPILPMIILFRAKSKSKTTVADIQTSYSKEKKGISDYLPKRGFLTAYRGGMMVITCAAILAVDFRVFPRRLAKVETWGTSLMDLGVGSFVFSMGVVSARPLLILKAKGIKPGFIKTLVESLKGSFSVLTLGVIRLVSVKLLDYQEHVTEYGTHWNFFITLGLIGPFTALFTIVLRYIPQSAIAIIITIAYELALTKTELLSYILMAPRIDIISHNKEGISSFVGYFSIFLVAQSIGLHVLPRRKPFKNEKNPKPTDDNLIFYMLTRAAFYQVVHFLVSTYYSYDVSRRIANAPYVTWVVSFNVFSLTVYILIEKCTFGNGFNYDEHVPYSLEVINKNGLFIFLLANVTTGLINMNIDTLNADNVKSMAILTSYLLFLFIAGIFLHINKIPKLI